MSTQGKSTTNIQLIYEMSPCLFLIVGKTIIVMGYSAKHFVFQLVIDLQCGL